MVKLKSKWDLLLFSDKSQKPRHIHVTFISFHIHR